MAEDLDLDRIIRDPAYRRRVIARLNLVAGDRVTEPEAENQDPPGYLPRINARRTDRF